MTFWSWLHRLGPGWPDARGWIGLGVFALSVMLLGMMYADTGFRGDEFVQTIATLVIGTGFVGGAVAWAYSATKTGGELSESSARIAEAAAGVPLAHPAEPMPVIVANTTSEPVPTSDATLEEFKP